MKYAAERFDSVTELNEWLHEMKNIAPISLTSDANCEGGNSLVLLYRQD